MKLLDLLPRQHIRVPLQATTVAEATAALLEQLTDAGSVKNPRQVAKRLAERRERDIIMIGPHVAMPHCRTDDVHGPVLALGVAPEPLTLASAGEEAAPRIVVLILTPPDAAALHLQLVAALARVARLKGVIAGLLEAASADDILNIPDLADVTIMPQLTVRDLMVTTDAVGPDLPVREAVDLMVKKRLRALPVVGEKQEVLGVLSEWDVMRALLPQVPRAEGEMFADLRDTGLRVRDVMTRSVLCVSEDLGLDEAANMMLNKNVEQFPVVSEGKLSGLLSRGEIIRRLFAP
jgi:CBS domain-containing protein/mannitol/fructose-specific phosphotransferase system IIA component (Ntr-type)